MTLTKKLLSNPMMAAIMLMMFVPILSAVGPDLEKRFFPVVENVKIIKIEEYGEDKVSIWVTFEKARQCTFKGIGWYYQNPIGNSLQKLAFEFRDTPADDRITSRPVGKQISGPWIIGTTIGKFKNNVLAETNHDCHALWDSVSRFYP